MEKELWFYDDSMVERASCGGILHTSVLENVFHKAILPEFWEELTDDSNEIGAEIEINGTTYIVESYCPDEDYISIGLSKKQ